MKPIRVLLLFGLLPIFVRAHGTQTEESAGVLGLDKNGIALRCGACGLVLAQSSGAFTTQTDPEAYRTWEPIPGVIRDNGIDTLRFEVDTRGPVQAVRWLPPESYLTSDAPFPQYLRDDGLEGDRIAGDFVFTSRATRFNTNYQSMPGFFGHYTNGAEGVFVVDAGRMEILELDGTTNQFLIEPSVGLLSTNIPLVQTVAIASNVVVSPHLVNIQTSHRSTQKMMRGLDPPALTKTLYQSLPDVFDFLILFSTDHVERLPFLSGVNQNAGVHLTIKVNYTGTGLGPRDFSDGYGTQGRLLGVNVLDTFDRGISSYNATHELMHQWAAYLSPTLGLGSGFHYSGLSSAGSVLGGTVWIAEQNGTFRRECFDLFEASRLDKYLMGLISGSTVGPLYVYNGPGAQPACRAGVISNYNVVTIEDIQAIHGVRTPLPEQAQREFHLAFVAETLAHTSGDDLLRRFSGSLY